MTPAIASAFMPLMRWIDPERAHGLALRALRLGLAGRARGHGRRLLWRSHTLGRRFANPIGLAAGFDKDAVAVHALMRLGFGFVETGTVTPRPQAGNPRPRLFRLEPDQAVINRMGFNNAGLEAYLARLARRPRGPVVLGANVGINKDGADPERDYPALIAAVAPHADYAVINVSSPNTPGLRDLQGEAQLRAILRAVAERVPSRPPMLVKIAPDIGDEALAAVVETCVAGGRAGTDRVEHHDLPAPGAALAAGARGRRPVRGAAVPALHRRAGARLPAGARPARADRRRRRVHRRAGADQDPRGRDAGAALHRVRLRRPGADPAAEARTRRRAARRQVSHACRTRWARMRDVWQNSG